MKTKWAMIGVLMVTGGSMCEGAARRPPSDPATYRDILQLDSDVTKKIQATNTSLAATNDRVDSAENRLSKLEDKKILIEGAVRVLDTKRIDMEIFDSYDMAHSKDVAMGARVRLKLGKSYEERQIAKLQARLQQLEDLMLGELTKEGK